MKITQWLIGLALFSGILIALGTFSGSLFVEYGLPGTENLSSISMLNRSQQINDFANQTSNYIEGQSSFVATIFTSIGLLWSVLTQLLTLPWIFIGLANDVGDAMNLFGIGIPPWFMTMIGTIIIVVIVYKVAEIIGNRNEL